MNFVSEKLNLPLFLVTRNRIKEENLDPVRGHIASRRLSYTRHCNQENATATATSRHLKHLVGLDERPRHACPTARPLTLTRDLIVDKPWQLPPNRYDLPAQPFERLRGRGGAYWPEVGKSKARPTTATRGPRPQWKFYELHRDTERMTRPCHKHKGVFLSNARERRATTRCMVSSALTCYHNPSDPGPTTYTPTNHLMTQNISSAVKPKAPNPHVFLRNSCVPARPNAIHARHISFRPGPGRYETRFRDVCPCAPRLVYAPGLQLEVERQKRLKFRRQPYVRIRTRLFCTPEWRHVAGHGHRRLFRDAPKQKTRPAKDHKKDAKKSDRQFKLFPDARYISMITNPVRGALGLRQESMLELPQRVYYNCMAKRVVRRQLRNNKKIAFNSGQERFKDADRPPILTVSQLEEAKRRLPLERQLRDQPVMRCSASAIAAKLNETPPHMRPAYELELRKRLFKFLPLPGAKVLVTESDTRGKSVDGVVPAQCYFNKVLDVTEFFRRDLRPDE